MFENNVEKDVPYRSVTRVIPYTKHVLDYLHKKIRSKYQYSSEIEYKIDLETLLMRIQTGRAKGSNAYWGGSHGPC